MYLLQRGWKVLAVDIHDDQRFQTILAGLGAAPVRPYVRTCVRARCGRCLLVAAFVSTCVDAGAAVAAAFPRHCGELSSFRFRLHCVERVRCA